MITGTTRLYGIIGHPIGHVRVPMTFNARFERDGIDAVSLPFDATPERFSAAIRGLQALENLGGFVVTAPHKQAMVALCDEVVGEARLVGAVNTVRRDPDSRLVGELFDGHGFVRGLQAAGRDLAGKRIFLFGAGGAGHAVGFALARAGVGALTIHNRTTSKADDLARRIQAAYPGCRVEVAAKDPRGCDIVVNATSVGLHDDDQSIDVGGLAPSTLVAEVIMKPEKTALLRAAEARGLAIQQGRHMLDCQMDLMFDFMRIEAPR
ncbi:MAG: shikimate dehydrogenase [Proteobacteria bacterium]|nr:shikimate dehydrogenase [Pseudomonadota bacterium]